LEIGEFDVSENIETEETNGEQDRHISFNTLKIESAGLNSTSNKHKKSFSVFGSSDYRTRQANSSAFGGTQRIEFFSARSSSNG